MVAERTGECLRVDDRHRNQQHCYHTDVISNHRQPKPDYFDKRHTEMIGRTVTDLLRAGGTVKRSTGAVAVESGDESRTQDHFARA